MAADGAADTQLMLGVGLIEKDTNGEVLWVWCYPSTTATLRNLLLRKCCLADENRLLHPFVFGQYRRTWFYITTVEVPDSSVLKKVTHFSIVLTAKDFNPEKYAAFTRILCRLYLRHGSPVRMMESYIAVLTKGICQSEENGSFLSKDFDARKAYLAGSIKDVVSQFGMETVILHTALMLKKRIVVYHPKIEAVQEFTRTLPALVWHRQDWTILHSYVHLDADELEALQLCPGYIAGFVDSEVSNRSDLYDVFVNLADSEITIAPHAKGHFPKNKRNLHQLGTIFRSFRRRRKACSQSGGTKAKTVPTSNGKLPLPPRSRRADAENLTAKWSR
ncbi:DENN domain-containing protein 10 isoform X2 [Pipistrellus kuhlii]|uniref:DENN domain-containing protein 10 isoform X2 n=1 Tax=Pipistrellus kuhlii TaxID=59472 RepID=UPI00174F4889|nr:DENN domain-containing protein 10 isoform X2 [Pipistrellus kuhlii]